MLVTVASDKASNISIVALHRTLNVIQQNSVVINEKMFFSFTTKAWILVTSSASISVVLSMLVVYFISRSRDLSNSSYHKIMLFMSSWDVLVSLAMAFTTVPMPSDVHDVYPFSNKAFGTTVTCTCQGFIILMGSTYTIWSVCTLNIYYVCTIRYGMSEQTFDRWVLPLMLTVSTVHVCIISYFCFSMDLFNPRVFEPICFSSPYPYNCIKNDDVECIRGDISMAMNELLANVVMITIGMSFLCVVTSMALVVAAVFKTEMILRISTSGARAGTVAGTSQQNNSNVSSLWNTRIALRQALMYIVAFLLTWVWVGIGATSVSDEPLPIINPMKLFFLPLHGFFNGAIFFCNKVSILRKADPNLSRFAALKRTILSPSRVPRVLMSQIGAIGAADDEDDNGNNINDDYRSRSSSQSQTSVSPKESVASDLARNGALDGPIERNVVNNAEEDAPKDMERYDDEAPAQPSSPGAVAASSTAIREQNPQTYKYYDVPRQILSHSYADRYGKQNRNRNPSEASASSLSSNTNNKSTNDQSLSGIDMDSNGNASSSIHDDDTTVRRSGAGNRPFILADFESFSTAGGYLSVSDVDMSQ